MCTESHGAFKGKQLQIMVDTKIVLLCASDVITATPLQKKQKSSDQTTPESPASASSVRTLTVHKIT